MRALVIGASGLVGRYLMRALSGEQATGTYLGYPVEGLTRLDIRDRNAVARFFESEKPDTVFLPAAFTNVDACEEKKDECRRSNVDGARSLAEECRGRGCYLVFFSTDFIFDGNDGPYDEEARPHPVSVYGSSKMESEFLVTHLCPGSLIIRTTCVYGWEARAKNFAQRLITQLPTGQTIRVPADQVTTPTYAADLADTVARLARLRRSGVYNVAGKTLQTRYAFAQQLASVFDLDERGIVAVQTTSLASAAARPLKGGLLCRKVEADLGITMPDTAMSLKRMKDDREKYGNPR